MDSVSDDDHNDDADDVGCWWLLLLVVGGANRGGSLMQSISTSPHRRQVCADTTSRPRYCHKLCL